MSRNFNEFDEQARELEAKAKKLRRDKKNAMRDAYASALVKHFPKVKECESVEEIDAYVRQIRKHVVRSHAEESSEARPASSGQQGVRSDGMPQGYSQPNGYRQQ